MQSSRKCILMTAVFHYHNDDDDRQRSFSLRFIDSFAFLASSLETLVSSISKNELILTTNILHFKYHNVVWMNISHTCTLDHILLV